MADERDVQPSGNRWVGDYLAGCIVEGLLAIPYYIVVFALSMAFGVSRGQIVLIFLGAVIAYVLVRWVYRLFRPRPQPVKGTERTEGNKLGIRNFWPKY